MLARLLLLLLALAGCGSEPPGSEAESGTEQDFAPAQSSVQADLAPSFDCSQAEGQVEELICSTPELAALDLHMDTVWQGAMDVMEQGNMPESDRATIRAEQRGWAEGRNDCWQSDDVEACVRSEYQVRTARLMADFGLAEAGEPTFWSCEGNPANEFVLTFFQTEPQSVRVERGDRQEVMIRTPTASGSRYLGTFGKEVWVKGAEGTFIWPQTDTLRCVDASGG